MINDYVVNIQILQGHHAKIVVSKLVKTSDSRSSPPVAFSNWQRTVGDLLGVTFAKT